MPKDFVITPELAEAELAWRDLAKAHLADFGEYVLPEWQAFPVHQLVCEALESVYEYISTGGESGIGALIIEMPPQSGKSTMAIKLFISWILGKRPDVRSLIATYGADLSKSHSEETQEIVTGERYQALFGKMAATEMQITVDRDTSSKSFWRIGGHRGSVMAVGVGGGGVGRSFELVCIDDPYKNAEEAFNRDQRKKVSRWFKNTVITRRKKGTAIVLIHTRWTREDLIGEQVRLMVTNPKALQWKIISIPALPLSDTELANDELEQTAAMREGVYLPTGDPLGREAGSEVSYCPELFPTDHLLTTKATLEADGDSLVWYATYEQKPRPESGEFFGSNDIKIIPAAPEGLQWFRYEDLAIGKSAKSDYNTSAAVAVDALANIYVRDMVRIRSFLEFKPVIKQVMLMEHRVTLFGVETNAFQELAFLDFINDKDLVGVAIFPIVASDSKQSDARVVQARAKVGKLYFIEGDWNQEAIDEFVDFPGGSHDDQVDTISKGVKMAFIYGGQVQEPQDQIIVYDERVEISEY